VPIPSNVTVTEMGDAVDINISSDDGVAAVGASVCRNDGGDEMDANDPRSTLGQIDNTSLCASDPASSTGKKVSMLCFAVCIRQ